MSERPIHADAMLSWFMVGMILLMLLWVLVA